MNYEFRADVSKASLDLMFLSNYGNRNPSPIVEIVQETYGKELTSEQLDTLAEMALEMFKPRWDKLGRIYDIEYDPIHNYLDEWEDSQESAEENKVETQGAKITSYGKVVDGDDEVTSQSSRSIGRESSNSNTRTDDITNSEIRNLTNESTRTDNLSEQVTHGRTDTRTDNLNERIDDDTQSSGQNANENTFYGFNSNGANNDTGNSGSHSENSQKDYTRVNTGTQATVTSGTDGVTNTGTQTVNERNTGSLTNSQTGTVADVGSETESTIDNGFGAKRTKGQTISSGDDALNSFGNEVTKGQTARDRAGKHIGNIGNLTSQQQIQEEIRLWQWKYMDMILEDVKDFMTLPVYLEHDILVDQDVKD